MFIAGIIIKSSVITFLLFAFSSLCLAQDWRDRMDSLIYSPKFFGPNAFPIPELIAGKISNEYEIGVRFDYHSAEGDNTRDFYARGHIPFGTKAALEVSGVFYEKYRTSEKIKEERYAAWMELQGNDLCYGDITITSMFQVLESDKWFDAMIFAGIKTASGNRLSDARHTDAASYWVGVDIGKNIFQSEKRDRYLRLGGMFGFYCYMTNLPHNRQNDAWMASGGILFRIENVYFDTTLRGFQGYWDEGDEPLLFHSQLKYRIRNHSFYCRYQYGLHDFIYQTFSGGYTFSF